MNHETITIRIGLHNPQGAALEALQDAVRHALDADAIDAVIAPALERHGAETLSASVDGIPPVYTGYAADLDGKGRE